MAEVFRKAFQVIFDSDSTSDDDDSDYVEKLKHVFGEHFTDYNQFSAEEIADFPAITEEQERHLEALRKKGLTDVTSFLFTPFYSKLELGLYSPEAIKTLDYATHRFELKTRYKLFDESEKMVKKGNVEKPSEILTQDLGDKAVVLSLFGKGLNVVCGEESLEFRTRDNISPRKLLIVDAVFRCLYKRQPFVMDISRDYPLLTELEKSAIKARGQG